jgi:hypothetical protein
VKAKKTLNDATNRKKVARVAGAIGDLQKRKLSCVVSDPKEEIVAQGQPQKKPQLGRPIIQISSCGFFCGCP